MTNKKYDVSRICEELGIDIVTSTSSNNFLCYCPFHDDIGGGKPSFTISENGPWFCHSGNCGKKGGSLVYLVSELTGLSLVDSEKVVGSEKNVSDISDDFYNEITEILEVKEDVLPPYKHIYHPYFVNDREKDKHGKLIARGISKETVQTFRLGYASAREALVFPIFRTKGDLIVAYKYRYLTGPMRFSFKSQKNFKKNYLFGFNITKQYVDDGIILVEGEFDMLSLYDRGFRNVACLMGSTMTNGQFYEIYRHCNKVYLMLDNDKAGKKATNQIMNKFYGKVECKKLLYPEQYNDPDDFLNDCMNANNIIKEQL